MEFKESNVAFETAIAAGWLSEDDKSPFFAGLFMYMGTLNGWDLFKQKETKTYLDYLRVGSFQAAGGPLA